MNSCERTSIRMPAWRAKKKSTKTAKNMRSAAKQENTKKRIRCSSSRGLRPRSFQSSSPPPPPPPVGRRSTGGLPPIPGSFRSVSAGLRVKVEGMGEPLRGSEWPYLGLDAGGCRGDGFSSSERREAAIYLRAVNGQPSRRPQKVGERVGLERVQDEMLRP